MINFFFFFGKRVLFDQKNPEDRPGPGEKNWKMCFIRSEKAIGPAGTGGKKIEKIRKFSTLRITGPAGPDRHRPGPAPLPEFSVLAGSY